MKGKLKADLIELKEKLKNLAEKAAIPGILIALTAIFGEYQSIEDTKQPVVGETVSIIDNNDPIYSTAYDAMNNTNKKKAFYDASYDRYVVAAYYELEGKIIRANTKQQEQKLLNQDGKIVAVLTEVYDKNYPVLEGFVDPKDLRIPEQKTTNKQKKIG